MRSPHLLLLPLVLVSLTMCRCNDDLDWWQATIVYQIYPRSFQDSNTDGIGDIPGIISRLDYFQYLGVDTLWLSPIYTSPMKDFGYDVSDHKDIDPIFGNLADVDRLIEQMHRRGMKLIMDYIPNHTSDLHPWFQSSRQGAGGKYADYYRWHEGKKAEDGTRQPPNNWLSIFGGSAWQWDDQRQAYYFHQFIPEQPDLDYRNPAVRRDMEDVLSFWIERGVDGFRVDAIQTLFEVEDLSLNEPRSGRNVPENQHAYLEHIYTMNQPEIHEVVAEWRDLFNRYEQKTGKHIFMVMEAYNKNPSILMKYYETGADMPYNFYLLEADSTCGGKCHSDLVRSFMDYMPPGRWPNFVLGNHDRKRVSARKGPQYTSALNVMLLTLPGTPTTYYGEELGMLPITVSYEETQDPWGKFFGPVSPISASSAHYDKFSRDPCRAPMQWNAEKHAGFSTAPKTWLPVHPGYTQLNVQVQMEDQAHSSHLQIYRRVATLRKEHTFQRGQLLYHVTNRDVFSYVRHVTGDLNPYMVILNLGNRKFSGNFELGLSGELKCDKGNVVVHTGNDAKSNFRVTQEVSLEDVTLHPGDALVLKLSCATDDEQEENVNNEGIKTKANSAVKEYDNEKNKENEDVDIIEDIESSSHYTTSAYEKPPSTKLTYNQWIDNIYYVCKYTLKVKVLIFKLMGYKGLT